MITSSTAVAPAAAGGGKGAGAIAAGPGAGAIKRHVGREWILPVSVAVAGRESRGGGLAWSAFPRQRGANRKGNSNADAGPEGRRGNRDRRGGKTVSLPLAEFRRRVETGEGCDLFDVGAS